MGRRADPGPIVSAKPAGSIARVPCRSMAFQAARRAASACR